MNGNIPSFDISDFPVETTSPVIDVTLPVGIHQLELVVVDDAGNESEPEQVLVTVEAEPVAPGRIDNVQPATVPPGQLTEVSIFGSGLAEVTDVTFETTAGGSVPAEVQVVASTEIRVDLRVTFPPIEPQALNFTVTTSRESIRSADFGVSLQLDSGAGRLDGVSPREVAAGVATQVIVTGSGLLGATAVHFFDMVTGEPVAGPVPIVRSSNTELALDVRLPATVSREVSFLVDTPRETLNSADFGLSLLVQVPASLGAIEPPAVPAGVANSVVIFGTGLATAVGVRFIDAVTGEGVDEFPVQGSSETEVRLEVTFLAGDTRRLFFIVEGAGFSLNSSDFGVFLTLTSEPGFIETIQPSAIASGVLSRVVISGGGFPGPTQVSFVTTSGLGLPRDSQVEIVDGTDTQLTLDVRFPFSAAERLSFIVHTPVGDLDSAQFGVFLTVNPVIQEIGSIEAIQPSTVSSTISTEVRIFGTGLSTTSGVTFVDAADNRIATGEARAVSSREILVGVAFPFTAGDQQLAFIVARSGAQSLHSAPFGVFLTVTELFPFVREVDGIGPARAKRLEEAEITTVDQLVAAEPDQVAKVLKLSQEKTGDLLEQAKKMLKT